MTCIFLMTEVRYLSVSLEGFNKKLEKTSLMSHGHNHTRSYRECKKASETIIIFDVAFLSQRSTIIINDWQWKPSIPKEKEKTMQRKCKTQMNKLNYSVWNKTNDEKHFLIQRIISYQVKKMSDLLIDVLEEAFLHLHLVGVHIFSLPGPWY